MFSGHWEILIIVLIIFFLFGAKRIPDMMENMAKGIQSFKKGMNDDGNSTTKDDTKEIAQGGETVSETVKEKE